MIETRPYSEFSRSVLGRVTERSPLSVTIEVTDRCSLNCAHCYNNLPMNDAAARRREMTTEEHYRLVDTLVDAGCLWLLYSGGEIFARRDFLDIYTHARKRGLIVSLFTNGTLITERVADHLAEWRPFGIEITLYGRTRETYEALTRVPGSYDRCMRGIELLIERRLPLKLKTVGTTINKHEVAGMKRWVREELGLEFMFDAMINPRIDCSHSPLGVRLSPEEVVELDLQDSDRVREWKVLADQWVGSALPRRVEDELYTCGGGMTSLAIDPYGAMTICVISHADSFNVRSGNFADGWQNFLYDVRSRKITRPTKCLSCGLGSFCTMCPANGELENLDPESPVDFLCHVAHLRASVLGVEVPPHGDCEYCPGGTCYDRLRLGSEALLSGNAAVVQQLVVERGEDSSSLSPASCSTGACTACSLAPIVRK